MSHDYTIDQQAKDGISHKISEENHAHYYGVDKAEEHLSVDEALGLFLSNLKQMRSETIALQESNNRILFEDINAPANLPRLARSTRDGYAVRIPANSPPIDAEYSFKIVGDVRIGVVPKLRLSNGQAVRISTGSYVPYGVNAVVMVEYSRLKDDDPTVVTINRAIKVGENILSPGEDIKKGTLLFARGTRLRPHHVALLSMFGMTRLKVFRKPRIAFYSTGDELADAVNNAKKGNITAIKRGRFEKNRLFIYDSTRPFLNSIITELVGSPIDLGIARDNFQQIKAKMREGLKYDALILSAGSSVGERDFVSAAAESIKGVKIVVHGVAMRPSSPTALAVFRGKPVVLLPGFPTSAIVSFFVFGRPAILKLSGLSNTEPPMISATLEDGEYTGKKGITHFVRVYVSKKGSGYVARISKPIEAQYSSWLRASNGIAVLNKDSEPILRSGDQISVFMIGDL